MALVDNVYKPKIGTEKLSNQNYSMLEFPDQPQSDQKKARCAPISNDLSLYGFNSRENEHIPIIQKTKRNLQQKNSLGLKETSMQSLQEIRN